MRVNPYTVGNPISGKSGFFGRDDIFREVMQVLRHPQSNAIVLYGQRRIGKTSILLQLEQQLATTSEFIPIYFNLQDKANKPLNQVLVELAQRIAHAVGQATPEPNLFDVEGDYFRQRFLPQAATKRELVLLFDEFDVLDGPQQSQAGQTFFPYLRQWMADIKRVHFVFVIGRRPEDLSTHAIATFKGVRATRVSRLEQEVAAKVVHQSEQNGTLPWSQTAVDQVWWWAQGHPFFSQLLCSVVWEKANEREETAEPVTAVQVDKAVDKALQEGGNAFTWIWGGLPPAERVAIAAMAKSPEEVITRTQLVDTLNQSGILFIAPQLESAPEVLVEWDVLQPTQDGYRFTVPLLRQWVVKNQPMRRVKEELDRVDIRADRLFQTGQDYYSLGQLQEAENQLRRAIRINPNHLKAKLLLGKILLEGGGLNSPTSVPTAIVPSIETLEEAVKILEEAYQYDTETARSELIRALLALSGRQDGTLQLTTLERILQIQPGQPTAKVKAEQIRQVRRKRDLQTKVETASHHEANENWNEAVTIYQVLLQEFPDEADWQTRLQKAQTQAILSQRYYEAVGALDAGNTTTAQRLLAEVIAIQPNYKEAARHLLRATTGVDVAALQQKHLTEKAEMTPISLRQLSELNPLDYLRLLWRLFMTPQQLKQYQTQVREKGGYLVVNWLASTFTWLPIFLLSLALGLGTLPTTSSFSFSSTIYQRITACLILAWILTGFGGKHKTDKRVVVMALTTASVTALGVALSMVSNVVGDLALGVMFVVTVVVAGGVELGGGIVLMLVILLDVIGVWRGVVSAAEGIVGAIAGAMVVGIVAGVIEGVMDIVAGVVENNTKSGWASWQARGILLVLLVVYTFIVWYAFLGGYKLWN